jgi:hypothetical protein
MTAKKIFYTATINGRPVKFTGVISGNQYLVPTTGRKASLVLR